jgi:hypothetical protein
MHIVTHKVHELERAKDICDNNLVVVTSIKVVTSEKGVYCLRVAFVSEAVQRRSPQPAPTFLQTRRHAPRSFDRDRLTTEGQNSTEDEQREWTGARSMYCLTPSENKHNCIIARKKVN